MIPSTAAGAAKWAANRAVHLIAPVAIIATAGAIVAAFGIVALYGATCKAKAEIFAILRRQNASP